MKGDFLQLWSAHTRGHVKAQAVEYARVAYDAGTKVAEDLVVMHPIRLGLALNYSVFQYEVLQKQEEAVNMSRLFLQQCSNSFSPWESPCTEFSVRSS